MTGAIVYTLGTTRRKGDYQGTNQTPGLCDLIVFLPDGPNRRLLMIEVKSARGKLSPAQLVFRACCRLAKVDHLDGGLDVVLAWLKREGYTR